MHTRTGFHNYYDSLIRRDDPLLDRLKPRGEITTVRTLKYRFVSHFHPYAAALSARLVRRSVRGLQDADTEYRRNSNGTVMTFPDGSPRPVLHDEIFSTTDYNPTSLVVERPIKELDFRLSAPYGIYNWEIFFHAPFAIAVQLSRSQRFEEAQRWFHFIFDPTDDSDGPTPQRFWKVRPFQSSSVRLIEEVLVNLAAGVNAELRDETIRSIGAWKDAPFRPHVIARHRQSAYMLKTVMAYLDNLIAWGDALFRQDTLESINEATQLYVLAANILGPRPQAIPKKGSVRPQTYATLRADLDAFGNALRDLETEIPFDLAPHPDDGTGADEFTTLRSIGRALYFGVPRNDKLLGYWDTVADRLFKIRNSLNLQGIFRQLPLFDPPIDPAMLARAAAAGVDVTAVISGAVQPLPLVRFQLLLQKAVEICQEVKAFGGHLLSAIEKEDNETLAAMRARHERVILSLVESVRYQQWQESIKSRESLQVSLANAVQRYTYYERLLGKKESDVQVPALDALDTAGLDDMRFRATEPAVGLRPIKVDIVEAIQGLPGGVTISSHEAAELALMEAANTLQTAAGVLDAAAGPLGLIPQFHVRVTPWGIGAGGTFGGDQLSRIAAFMASMSRTLAGGLSGAASTAAKIGGYVRREQDWTFQSNLAAGEITQLLKQLRAAEIREHMAERELENHRRQIAHAEEVERFLTDERHGKTTTTAFYAWLRREVKALHAQCFQFAFDVARKAERALQHELGNPALTFVQFGYLGGKEGLLAGEKLHLDLKRMEVAYHELNQREYELTKHVSLLQVNPQALLQLRTSGRCTVFLPEALFDFDAPGHYFRRIKSAAVSIPCVTGPYTGVNCRLTLLKSTDSPQPVVERRQLSPRRRRRRALQRSLRQPAGDRHQQRPARRRPVRSELPRRALSAVRGRGSGQ